MSNKKISNKMWGGRFNDQTLPLMEEINSSIDIDKRLALVDIMGSRAHVKMLAESKIVKQTTKQKILKGLDQIEKEVISGKFSYKKSLEDIHMNIESRLEKIIGHEAGMLHTARSRNDQVVTDFRIWTRESIDQIKRELEALKQTFVELAEKNFDAIFPGYTHMQIAQPVKFSHHMLAYVEMFHRDSLRFDETRKRLNECPLGAVALAGTSFPIDRKYTAKELGFDGPMRNSMDAVSDRDFVIEFIFNTSICMMHFSRLAEELILWSSSEFNFIDLPDNLATGSSIMPQKKNPDAAELIRAKSGRVYGSLISQLTMMKGLPLSYSKDMQEDKESAFDAFDTLILVIKITNLLIGSVQINKENMEKQAEHGFSTATDLADWLVKNLNIPFREAHRVTGRIVNFALKNDIKLSEIQLSDLKKFDSRINKDVFNILNVKSSVDSRNSYGGTSSEQVKKQLRYWKKRLND